MVRRNIHHHRSPYMSGASPNRSLLLGALGLEGFTTNCLRTPKKLKNTFLLIKGNIGILILYSFGVLKRTVD